MDRVDSFSFGMGLTVREPLKPTLAINGDELVPGMSMMISIGGGWELNWSFMAGGGGGGIFWKRRAREMIIKSGQGILMEQQK